MVGHSPNNQRTVTGYISGWRLWLSILAIAFSLTLLSQAHRIIGLSQPSTVSHSWVITAHGLLTPQQQRDIELQLRSAVDQLPQLAELRYSLQSTTRHSNNPESGVTEN